MPLLPETYKREYYTTARIVHAPESEDWLWVNASQSWQFISIDGAQSHANLSNDNGRESGLDIDNYPYFVVKVTQTSKIEAA